MIMGSINTDDIPLTAHLSERHDTAKCFPSKNNGSNKKAEKELVKGIMG